MLLLTATVASGALLDRSREVEPKGRLRVSSPLTVARRVPSALFTGDSYTAGTGAADPHHGYACLATQAMGWHYNLDAEGGTGYLNDGASNSDKFVPFIDRLSSDKAKFLADLIVVDGDPLRDLSLFHEDGRHVPVVMKAGVIMKGEA